MTDDISLPQLALLLAERFLGAPWSSLGLVDSGRDLLPRGRWWQVELCASAALNTYRRKPHDRPHELAETLLDALAPGRALPAVQVRQLRIREIPTWQRASHRMNLRTGCRALRPMR